MSATVGEYLPRVDEAGKALELLKQGVYGVILMEQRWRESSPADVERMRRRLGADCGTELSVLWLKYSGALLFVTDL